MLGLDNLHHAHLDLGSKDLEHHDLEEVLASLVASSGGRVGGLEVVLDLHKQDRAFDEIDPSDPLGIEVWHGRPLIVLV